MEQMEPPLPLTRTLSVQVGQDSMDLTWLWEHKRDTKLNRIVDRYFFSNRIPVCVYSSYFHGRLLQWCRTRTRVRKWYRKVQRRLRHNVIRNVFVHFPEDVLEYCLLPYVS